MSSLRWVFFFIAFYSISARASDDLNLDSLELAWIKNNPVITYSGDPSWAPYDYNDNGEHKGISRNYLDRISEITGLQFKYVPSDSWTGIRDLFKEGKIMMIPALVESRERARHLDFSKPYINEEYVIITSEKERRIFDENDLANLRIVVVRDYWITNQLKTKFPRFDYVEVKSTPECFEVIEGGEAEAAIMDFTVAMYFIEKNSFSDLKIVPSIFEEEVIQMGILSGNEPLVGILNKALVSMDDSEKAEMRNEFFEVSLKSGIPRKYIRMFSMGLIFLGVVVIVVILWNQTLQKEVRSRKAAEGRLVQANVNLRAKSDELNQALDSLKKMQAKLVQAEKLSAIGQMSEVVNHEINNLLNYLRASISPLKRDIEFLASIQGKELTKKDEVEFDEIKKEVSVLLENLEQGSGQASEIITEIGQFGRAGNREKRPLNPNQLVEATIKLLNPSIPSGVKLVLDLQATRALLALTGPIKQVMINLLKNSLEAMGESGQIRISTYDHANDLVGFKISDEGLGIAPENHEKVFEPFYTTKKSSGGSGLGLAIVQKVVRDHGGSISLNSEVGKGTEFTLEFPAITG